MDKGDDPYRILGLYKSDVTVDPSSIKKAYRKLARIHHPDKNNGGGTSTATLTFAKISHAYEILRDEESRKSYDLSQLHCDQQGYDPNGPTYYDRTNRNHADVNGKNNNIAKKKTKKNSSTTESTKRRTTYYPVAPQPARQQQQQQHQKKKHQPAGGGDLFSSRTATTTTTDTASGKPKTFSYTTTSEGITTVDVKAPDGTRFSFSVPRHDEDKHKEVYDLFRGQFGRDAADDFFNIVGSSSSSVGVGSEKKDKSTKSKSNSKKAKEHRRNRITSPPSSPRRVVTNLYGIPSTITTSTSSSKPTSNTTNSKKQKKKKTVPNNMTRRILPLSNTDTNTIASTDNTNGDIRSTSTKERIVVNPKTKRKEVVVKTTLTKFDGSVETSTERRKL